MRKRKSTFKLSTKESIVIWLVAVFFIASLSSCGVRVKGTCSGNKTMAFYGGFSRKAFNH